MEAFSTCAANGITGVVEWIGAGAEKLHAKVSDGTRALDAVIHDPTSTFGFIADLDGASQIRSAPGIFGLNGGFSDLEIRLYDDGQEAAGFWDFSEVASYGSTSFDALALWDEEETPLGSPETWLEGIIQPPDDLIEPKCLKENQTTGRCEEYESKEQVENRVAPILKSVLNLRDGVEWAIPEERWVDVLPWRT